MSVLLSSVILLPLLPKLVRSASPFLHLQFSFLLCHFSITSSHIYVSLQPKLCYFLPLSSAFLCSSSSSFTPKACPFCIPFSSPSYLCLPSTQALDVQASWSKSSLFCPISFLPVLLPLAS